MGLPANPFLYGRALSQPAPARSLDKNIGIYSGGFENAGEPGAAFDTRVPLGPAAEGFRDEYEVCAKDVEELLGVTQPTVSYHMKMLVGAGLVAAHNSTAAVRAVSLSGRGFERLPDDFSGISWAFFVPQKAYRG